MNETKIYILIYKYRYDSKIIGFFTSRLDAEYQAWKKNKEIIKEYHYGRLYPLEYSYCTEEILPVKSIKEKDYDKFIGEKSFEIKEKIVKSQEHSKSDLLEVQQLEKELEFYLQTKDKPNE